MGFRLFLVRFALSPSPAVGGPARHRRALGFLVGRLNPLRCNHCKCLFPRTVSPPWIFPLQADRQDIEGLRGQVAAAREALQREQDLVEKVKREAAAAANAAQRQVCVRGLVRIEQKGSGVGWVAGSGGEIPARCGCRGQPSAAAGAFV